MHWIYAGRNEAIFLWHKPAKRKWKREHFLFNCAHRFHNRSYWNAKLHTVKQHLLHRFSLVLSFYLYFYNQSFVVGTSNVRLLCFNVCLLKLQYNKKWNVSFRWRLFLFLWLETATNKYMYSDLEMFWGKKMERIKYVLEFCFIN